MIAHSFFRCFSIGFAIAIVAVTGLAQPPTTQTAASTQPGQPIEVNLKEMSLFDLDQVNGVPSDLPQSLRDLDGKRVTFGSEMWAPKAADDGSGLSFFQAVYSKSHWTFRGPPVAQNFWDCVPLAGTAINYSDAPVRVTGVLHIKFRKEDGVIKSICEVDVERVEPFKGDFPPRPKGATRPDL